MRGWLIYHSNREKFNVDNLTIYHDSFSHNQDPYVWNEKFLYSYCHITQLPRKEIKKGDIFFWVSSSHFQTFDDLLCDLVFEVDEICKWKRPNCIPQKEIIDSKEAFFDHYRWFEDHYFNDKRDRYTYKAEPNHSFQPLSEKYDLYDIMPILLNSNRFASKLEVKNHFMAGTTTKPIELSENEISEIKKYLLKSKFKLYGKQLENIRKNNGTLIENGKPKKGSLKLGRIYYPVKTLVNGASIEILMFGCIKKCKDCLSLELQKPDKNKRIKLSFLYDMIYEIAEKNEIDGVTLLGGEIFDQVGVFYSFIKFIKLFCDDILVYTSYTKQELDEKKDKRIDWILDNIVVLSNGKYIHELNNDKALRGSSNQNIYLLKKEYEQAYKNLLGHQRQSQVEICEGKIIHIGILKKI